MRITLSTTLILFLAMVAFVPDARAQEQSGRPDGAVLIAKGPGYLIHQFAGSVRPSDFVESVVKPGLTIAYTSVETGEMKWLCVSGTFGTRQRRQIFYSTRIIDLAQDAERLYVLVWESGPMIYPNGPTEPDKQGYSLQVFWKSDGSQIHATALKSKEGLARGVPEEGTGLGVLKLVEGGVECFGEKIRFKGRQVVTGRGVQQ
ncbi:MAG TPA: hypothetical protein VKB86_21975 [Pyrinomonadaceae bacterium]|nr:hypothetical protein [Pyrinomonadaceae bacterium]